MDRFALALRVSSEGYDLIDADSGRVLDGVRDCQVEQLINGFDVVTTSATTSFMPRQREMLVHLTVVLGQIVNASNEPVAVESLPASLPVRKFRFEE